MESGQLHPLTLAFKSSQLESQYWAHALPRMRAKSTVAVATVLALWAIFAFLNPMIVREALVQIWVIRVLVFLLGFFLLAAFRTSLFERRHQLLLASLPILGGGGILVRKVQSSTIAHRHVQASILFADIVRFTSYQSILQQLLSAPDEEELFHYETI